MSPFESWIPKQKRWARLLERINLGFERPVNQFSQTTQLNPLYHTGTISLFLLALVVASGFFLFVFFQYGYETSYEAVARLESQPIGRLTRAVHRYASGALLVTTLLHAIRMLFMERFRGPRRLAWVSGQVMVALIWIAGITGYWLLQDERAHYLTSLLIDGFSRWTPWGDSVANWLISLESDGSWVFVFIILLSHVLATLAVGGFFYLHVKRLSRAKLFLDMPWLIGTGAVLLFGSLLFPVGLLDPIEFNIRPTAFSIDLIFLFFIVNRWGWVIWVGLFVAGLALTFLPWLSKETQPLPKVSVIDERCTGCTRCANDCPYGALTMIDQPEGAAHPFLAVANPDLCVSCGICVGSCLDDAITLGETDPADLRTLVTDRIAHAAARIPNQELADIELVFTCSRFANQSAAPYLRWEVEQVEATHELIEVIPVPCAGAVPPDLLIYALDQGAAEVRLIGCPPDDCANREGNLIAEQRLTRERPPKLKRAYANVPISAVWTTPDQFDAALQEDVSDAESNWLESRRLFQQLTWKNFIPAFALLSIVMLIQIAAGLFPFQSAAADLATVQIVLPNISPPILITDPNITTNLILEVDGVPQNQKVIPAELFSNNQADPFYTDFDIEPGPHTLHLYLQIEGEDDQFTVAKWWGDAEAGEIIRLQEQRWGGRPGH